MAAGDCRFGATKSPRRVPLNFTRQDCEDVTRPTERQRGIRWEPNRGRWFVQYNHKSRKYYVGRFKDYEDACCALEQFKQSIKDKQ